MVKRTSYRETEAAVELLEKLQKSEKRLKYILDSIPDMVLEVDRELKVLWANKAALDLNPGAVGQTCYAAFPGNELPCDGCYCAKAFETGKIEKGTFYQPASKTAGESYWENIGVPLKDVEGNIRSVLEISRNVTTRVQNELEKERLIKELEAALQEVRVLSGLLPICCNCKKIRDDKGYWNQIESYIKKHSDVQFSHSICPQCAKRLYPDLYD